MWIANKAERLPDAQTGPHDEFAAAVLDGLSRPQKTLPCRFFYDARGSDLFEQITRLPEYYPTRTEAAILSAHADEIAAGMDPDGLLVEFGSGSSLKTEILLAAQPKLAVYVAIDVSKTALDDAKRRLNARFPSLQVVTIVADFNKPVDYPAEFSDRLKTGFFPGSTIGNLTTAEARRLLSTMRASLVPIGRLIIGVDLKKDTRRLIQAYDDAAGVTAAFNLNVLARINQELGAGIDLDAFHHKAIYNPREGRIEMHLVSERNQDIGVLGLRFHFRAGETIHTENSHKYTVEQFQELARCAGWSPRRVWLDPEGLFSVHELAQDAI